MDRKRSTQVFFGFDGNLSAMHLGDDIVTERKPQPRPLPGRLGGEEGLEDLDLDRGRDAIAVVSDFYFTS